VLTDLRGSGLPQWSVDEICALLERGRSLEWRDLPQRYGPNPSAKNSSEHDHSARSLGPRLLAPTRIPEVVAQDLTRRIRGCVTGSVRIARTGELLMRSATRSSRSAGCSRIRQTAANSVLFGLTSRSRPSTAASHDRHRHHLQGVISRGQEGVGSGSTGQRFHTLGPSATLLGLALKAYDPDHLVGRQEEIASAWALIRTNVPGCQDGPSPSRRAGVCEERVRNGATDHVSFDRLRHWR